MPAYQPVVNDVLELKIFCSAADQLGINVRHFRVASVEGAGLPLDALADTVSGILAPLYIAALGTNSRFEGVTLRKVWPLPLTLAFPDTSDASAGAVASDTLPRNVAGLIKLGSIEAGRAKRGRMYIPFPTEDHNDANGHPNAGYTGLLQAIGDSMVGPQLWKTAGDGFSVVGVLFRRLGGLQTVLTEAFPRKIWGRQIRRGDTGRTNQIVVG